MGKAQRKSERKMILKQEYKDYNRSNEKLRASNLYVKNLNVDIDDKRLEEVFSAYGKILSAKVMCHNDGTSRQFGFVCFASPEEANKALVALHGKTDSSSLSIYNFSFLFMLNWFHHLLISNL